MNDPVLVVELASDRDVVTARRLAREFAAEIGFDAQDQIRVATSVSEIARNATRYAKGGRVEFRLEGLTAPQVLTIRVSDHGPGIVDLEHVLSGRYVSRTGMGLGLVGARRLMDQLDVDSAPRRGTTVTMRKLLPQAAALVGPEQVAQLRAKFEHVERSNPVLELQQQNRELLRTLGELRERQDELVRLNRELEDTNRGVLALYAELDEKADHLRRADEMKSRFLSNMSHEFRTPLNSILALSRLLADRSDGPLSTEQETQVRFIRRAAEELTELVNDLLDLAKVEAGKIVVRAAEFEVQNLFGALRGMLRPLLVSEHVNLVFEEPQGVPPLVTDEAKVSQILRNFISNALKFTERGEVRVSARLADDGASVVFAVSDTGIGIAPEHHARIFEEFGQVENPLQQRYKGTGLGLPLSKRLAELLGGSLSLDSAPGLGSTFYATIPVVYASAQAAAEAVSEPELDPSRRPVLIVEDSPGELHVYDRLLRDSAFQPIVARTVHDAAARLRTLDPCAIVLDIKLAHEETWPFLARLKGDDALRHIPVLVVTSVDDEPKARALNADLYHAKPIDRSWLLDTLAHLAAVRQLALVVDDDDAARYTVKMLLRRLSVSAIEAASGTEALRRAREERPTVMLLDLMMPGMSGLELLDELRREQATEHVPAVIVSSKRLDDAERDAVARHGATFLPKDALGSDNAPERLRDVLIEAGWAPPGGESRA